MVWRTTRIKIRRNLKKKIEIGIFSVFQVNILTGGMRNLQLDLYLTS